MSVETLQRKGLFPHRFKYVGFMVSGLCILYALIHHFVEINLLFEGLHAPNMIFILGLIISISSREAYEDERVGQIRTYSHYVLSGLFVGYIFWEELDGVSETLVIELAAFLTVYVLIFHFIYYFDTGWILKHSFMSGFILVLILVVLLIIFQFLWLA